MTHRRLHRKQIVDAKGQFHSLAEPWADTGTSTGRLMIAVLGGLADVERDLIRTRTAEGRSRAQKRGQHMGRPSKLTDAQKAEARRRRAQGATLAELARSTFDLFAIVKQIVDTKAQFRSLAEPWADTGTSTGRLMIAVLGGLADVERDLIRTRTAEGRSRAQKRGQHTGRPPKLTAPQQIEARRRRSEGATLAELARRYGVGKSTISRLMA